MIRVHVICEGPTEEMFVNEVLREHLLQKGVQLSPSIVGKPGHKGGSVRLNRLFIDLRTRLMADKNAYCTTLFDFYGLPMDFPGNKQAKLQKESRYKARLLLEALTEYLRNELGDEPMRRFIPYVQMHEFEGLLFSDTAALAHAINQKVLHKRFQEIRKAFKSPEEINDNPSTAPSKRIMNLYSAFEKPLHGALAAIEIRLDKIREECPLFNDWLNRIEALSADR